MRLKKILCLLLAFCIPFFLFSACSAKNTPALNISGAEVSQDIYAYYLDKVVSKPANYGLGFAAAAQDLKDKATELCKEYVGVNTTLKGLGLKLSVGEKAAVSTKVNEYWHLYSKYYSAIGVSKQSLTKIESCNSAKDALLTYYYDNKGSKAIKEIDIMKYFNDNYVEFRAINGYLTKTDENNNTVDLTAEEKSALKSKLDSLAVRLTDGETFDAVSDRFASEQGGSSGNTDVIVIKKDNTAYPAGFFEAVAKIKPGKPKVILLDKYIFLILKVDSSGSDKDASDSNTNYYKLYRTDCLKALAGGEMDKEIESIADGYSVVKKDKIINKIYENISAGYES